MLVIKIGGSEGINYDTICDDLAKLWQCGRRLIVIHGGSHETNQIAEKLGLPPRFVTSVSGYESRYTDRQTLEVFEMVYCGKMNKMIVEKLQQRGVNAVGLSGIDGRTLVGERKAAIRIIEEGKKKVLRGDYTGKVEQVNRGLLELLLDNQYLPVISPPAISYEGEAINVDGDRAAACVAREFQAEKLVILSNVPGLLRDISDQASLVSKIPRAHADEFMSLALGRMKKKLMGACEAIDGGVPEVIFASGVIENPISRALEGMGTHIRS
jgi:acetylglutamate/LysW-gamma-L-alpha-aminoadipate kinase